jgi:hypothetical protein
VDNGTGRRFGHGSKRLRKIGIVALVDRSFKLGVFHER